MTDTLTPTSDSLDQKPVARLTDAEIVKAIAERVMGMSGFEIRCRVTEVERCGSPSQRFNPLRSDADACAVLDKMAEQFVVRIENVLWDAVLQGWRVVTWNGDGENFEATESDRRRAICLASLRAVGG